LKHLDINPLKNLKEINISNNQLRHLADFPESIETIHCDHNFLSTLDLKGIKNLRVLHCSHNRMIRIENFPEDTIRDFVMENNPMITIQNRGSHGESEENEEDKSIQAKLKKKSHREETNSERIKNILYIQQ
jgi:hypothetical protein